MNRLVIIDGNAILHRAYHALPPLTTPLGEPIQAVYGFTSMLLRLVTDLVPTRIAVVFDRPAPTFRKELFKEYQIKRPKMDDELVGQIGKVHDVVASLGIPIFEKDGFEADDLIGTITNNRKEEIIIVTGDKDLLQLVNDHVFCYMPTKGLSEAKLYGEKETVERLGVKPSLIPDYKALAGDASDNYPGIPGVGPKTAVAILQKAGSIDMLYRYIDTKDFGFSAGVLEKIKQGKESALLSHTLATIKRDVPMDIDIPLFQKEQLHKEEIIQLFETLGFHSLLKRLTGKEEVKKEKQEKKKNIMHDEEKEQLTLV